MMRFNLLLIVLFAQAAYADGLTAREVIHKIEQHTAGPWKGDTVDTIKGGDPETKVTGIATTFAATYDVLERAAQAGANLIITHEPTFYNHLDETKLFAHDAVYLAKRKFIDEHHLVVWRFHDHWHYPAMKPDGIQQGMVRALGWQAYANADDPLLFNLPETTLAKLSADIQTRMHIRALRTVGNPEMRVRRVALIPGAAGSEMQIQALERPDIEALVAGESREWETVEYVRDAVSQGAHKGLILLGHVVSEEEGMDYCAEWLKSFLPGVPIHFVPAREPFFSSATTSP